MFEITWRDYYYNLSSTCKLIKTLRNNFNELFVRFPVKDIVAKRYRIKGLNCVRAIRWKCMIAFHRPVESTLIQLLLL